MKKFFIVIAILLSTVATNAQQVKSTKEVKETIQANKTLLENPKKASNAKNWIKLGDSYLDAYATCQGNGNVGQTKTDVDILMAKNRAKATAKVEIDGKPFTKVSYGYADYYYNQGNVLALVHITRHIVKNELGEALKAYAKAAELDAKGKSTKSLVEKIKYIVDSYDEAAVNAYQLKDYAASSQAFENCYKASGTKPYSKVDTLSLYNAALTAWMAQNYERSEKLFKKSIELGACGADGDAYVKLADISSRNGDKATSKSYLEQGFEKFPESQGIIVALINYYLESGEDTNQLFSLLNKAKEKDPKNASLYYVEGTVNEKLGNGDAAVACYIKASEVNPAYTYGYVGAGLYYFKQADVIAEKASAEMNQSKYDALVVDYKTALKTGIPHMEKAYEVEKDPAMKKSIAAYLKNAWFRFRDDDAESKAKYEKFTEASK